MCERIPYRQIHLDFHTSEQIMGIGEKYDAKEFAATLKTAHVESINLFAKCHHGMFYYPTQIGMQHPGLKGRNLLGEQIAVLRDTKIRFNIYTCVGWNEYCSRKHPEWLQINRDGLIGMRKPFERGYYSWNFLCANKTAYRTIIKAELKEEYDLFHPAGFWIDIVFQNGCVCEDCIREIKEAGLNPENDEHIKRHDRIVEIGFCKEVYEFIKEMDPSLTVYFNGFSSEVDLADNVELSCQKKREYMDYIDIESLPSDTWGYTHFPMTANYLNKCSKEVTMMNGKFHLAWGDFGSIRNIAALEYECFRAIANGAKVCIGDQMHPCGKLDAAVYERIGKVFASIEAKEPWLIGTKKVADVAVLTTNKVLSGNPMSISIPDEGAYRILTESKIPFDYIDYLDDISKYKLIILPDYATISREYAIKLNEYTSNGGKILSTAKSGLFEGNFILDAVEADYCGISEYETRYMRFETGEFKEIPQIDHVLYLKGHKVSSKRNSRVLARIVPPYFNRSYEHFSSHRQTPPVLDASSEPAIIAGEHGIYISSPLFSDYAYNGYKVHKDIIVSCIRILMERQLCEAELPALSEVTIRENREGLIIHTISYCITRKCKVLDIIEDAIELVDRHYSIYTNFIPGKVMIVPECKEINFKYTDGYVHYTVPYQIGHNMVFITKNMEA